MDTETDGIESPSLRDANALLEAESRLASIATRCERILDLADPQHIHVILEQVREIRDIARGDSNV